MKQRKLTQRYRHQIYNKEKEVNVMYRVLKPHGATMPVMVENTETRASVNIGPVTSIIIRMLEEDGHKFDTDKPFLRDEWSINVSEETGKTLAKMAFTMKKPIRDQRKVKSEQDVPKSNQEIDAMDVLLGLAKYN